MITEALSVIIFFFLHTEDAVILFFDPASAAYARRGNSTIGKTGGGWIASGSWMKGTAVVAVLAGIRRLMVTRIRCLGGDTLAS